MRILVCHNFYQQAGGEDRVFAEESRLLESRGHEVVRFTRHNDALGSEGSVGAAANAIWSRAVHHELSDLLRRVRPAVVHFHNTFPLISPAGYYAAKRAGASVVQTLHNYRLLCPNALFFRDRRPCEDCMGKRVAWPAVVHRCYRGSMPASAAAASVLAIHRAAGTWQRQVDVYVALSEFARRKFLSGGLPAAKVVVKPHFVYDDPGIGAGEGRYALYVGRLSVEKGIQTLLDTWRRDPGLPSLHIVGEGPMVDEVRTAAASGVLEWHGSAPAGEVAALMAKAACVVVPSECYETFGRVIIESFAVGTPVVVSDHGAAAELVDDGGTGAHFRTGDPDDLARQVRRIVAVRPEEAERMRRAARATYEARFTAEANYHALAAIYRSAGAAIHRVGSGAFQAPGRAGGAA